MIVDRVTKEALARGHATPVNDETSANRNEVAPIASCGRSFPEHEIKIIDGEGNSLGERRVGEILLRGPSVANGYFEDADATASTWCDGWLHTGDLGYLAGGNLHVCGRSKDLIIVHGWNYHAQDIEWEAAQIQGSRKGNVVAFGIEDPKIGRERVIIVAETRLSVGHHRNFRQAIRARLLETLSLAVDQVVLVPPRTLPKTSSGRLQRARTRELFQSGKLGAQPEA